MGRAKRKRTADDPAALEAAAGRGAKRSCRAMTVTLGKRTRSDSDDGDRMSKRTKVMEQGSNCVPPEECSTPEACWLQLVPRVDGVLGVSEFARLAELIEIDPADLVLMVFAWRCRPSGPFCHLTRPEFIHGMEDRGCESFEDLKGSVPEMRAMLQSDSSFRQFYEFMFEWAKGRDRKILDKKMAISMFPLLLGDKTIYMAEWTGFLEKHSCRGINKDSWMQVLEFMLQMIDDDAMAKFDFEGRHSCMCTADSFPAYWPSLIDEFVEDYLTTRGIGQRDTMVVSSG